MKCSIAVLPFFVVSVYTGPGLAVVAATVSCGLIGFADDYIKVRRKRSLGLPGRWKMLGLLAVTGGVAYAVHVIDYVDTEIYFPIIDANVDLSYGYYGLLFLIIAGTANGVNLTDGLDGLAAGTVVVSLLTLLAMVAIQWLLRKRTLEDVVARSPWWLTVLIAAAMLFAVIVAQGSGEAFIYFQF